MYCNKSYIECYNFYQQYKNYFATTRVKGVKQIFFIISFLQDQISFCL